MSTQYIDSNVIKTALTIAVVVLLERSQTMNTSKNVKPQLGSNLSSGHDYWFTAVVKLNRNDKYV